MLDLNLLLVFIYFSLQNRIDFLYGLPVFLRSAARHQSRREICVILVAYPENCYVSNPPDNDGVFIQINSSVRLSICHFNN